MAITFIPRIERLPSDLGSGEAATQDDQRVHRSAKPTTDRRPLSFASSGAAARAPRRSPKRRARCGTDRASGGGTKSSWSCSRSSNRSRCRNRRRSGPTSYRSWSSSYPAVVGVVGRRLIGRAIASVVRRAGIAAGIRMAARIVGGRAFFLGLRRRQSVARAGHLYLCRRWRLHDRGLDHDRTLRGGWSRCQARGDSASSQLAAACGVIAAGGIITGGTQSRGSWVVSTNGLFDAPGAIVTAMSSPRYERAECRLRVSPRPSRHRGRRWLASDRRTDRRTRRCADRRWARSAGSPRCRRGDARRSETNRAPMLR